MSSPSLTLSATSQQVRPAGVVRVDPWPKVRRDLVTWIVLSDVASVVGPSVFALAVASSPVLGATSLASGALLLALSWISGTLGTDIVDQARTGSARILPSAFASVLGALLVAQLLGPTANQWGVWTILTLCATQVALVLIGRWSVTSWLRARRMEGQGLRRTLVIMGAGAESMLYQMRRHPADGFLVVGYLPATSDTWQTDADGVDGLARIIRSERVDVVMTLGGLTSQDFVPIMRSMEETRARLVVAPGLQDVVPSRMRGLSVTHGWTGLIDVRLRRTRARFKDVADRVLGALILLAISPVLALVALAIRLDSPGSPFYTQTRVGQDGRPFTMWKLRSMYIDADARRAALVAERGDAGNEILFKSSHDPRITRVGRLIRRTSIDELPQLINVVRGDMSLVGPRPALPEEVAQYDDEARRRLLVKPGLTGLWQVSGRSDLSWETSVALDRHYVENRGAALDAKVLAATVQAVVGGRGAY